MAAAVGERNPGWHDQATTRCRAAMLLGPAHRWAASAGIAAQGGYCPPVGHTACLAFCCRPKALQTPVSPSAAGRRPCNRPSRPPSVAGRRLRKSCFPPAEGLKDNSRQQAQRRCRTATVPQDFKAESLAPGPRICEPPNRGGLRWPKRTRRHRLARLRPLSRQGVINQPSANGPQNGREPEQP
jgi:hypothetical protein